MLAPLEHGLQTRAERERGLAGAGPAAHRHDPDVRVEQQIERDALLGAAALDAEGLPIAAHQPDVALGGDTAQGLAALRLDRQTGVHRQVGRFGDVRVSSSKRMSTCSPDRVSSDIPVQPEEPVMASSARYSSARRPTDEALILSGRSFETTVTSYPSACRLRATARMRESLSPGGTRWAGRWGPSG